MTTVNGNEANNTLFGGPANDSLFGFGGNDRLFGGPGADVLDGGDGRDMAIYSQALLPVTVSLQDGKGTTGEATNDTLISIEGITGTAFDDTLIGDHASNWLNGGQGNDHLIGNGGNDWISGGRGADVLEGGAGVDWLRYMRSDTGITIDLGMNTAQGGHAEGDVISGFENVEGSRFADVLIGSSQDNVLRGGNGNDQLFGGDGNDKLIGGLGADHMDGGDGFDTVSYADATDAAIVNTRSGQNGRGSRGDSWESIEAFIGSGFGDSIIMGDGNNRIVGGAGDDFIDGGAGNDRLIGGEGADQLFGNEGKDTVIYRASDAGVQANAGGHTSRGGHAEGDILSWINHIVGSQFDDTLTGNLLRNRLVGLDGDDILIGRQNSDRLQGGAGNDTFAFVELNDHLGHEQIHSQAITAYDDHTRDLILDFTSGEDKLRFNAAEFSGQVFETNDVQDLGLLDASDSAFAFTDSMLFYVRYEDQSDFDLGLISIHYIAELQGVTSLSLADLEFV